MSKATRLAINKSELPGPGMYESHEQYSFAKAKSPNYCFGTSKRDTGVGKANDSQPGPGNYNSDKLKSSVAFKFAGKYKEKLNEGPGPGSYE